MSTVFLRRSEPPRRHAPTRRASNLRRICTATPLLALAGCAVRLGGPKPEDYHVVAVFAGAAAAADVAERIQQADAEVAFVFAAGDSAWFADAEARSGRHLSGPAVEGGMGIGFLAGEAVGDTTVVLTLDGGADLPVQDALYQVDENRYLDLMALRLPMGTDTRAVASALLAYMATDVMNGAAVVLAVAAEQPVDGAELARQLDPALVGGPTCEEPATLEGFQPIRILYGPELQIRCNRIRIMDGDPWTLRADMVVRR